MGRRSAYSDPFVRIFQYASLARPRASRPMRISSITAPRSFSTSSSETRTLVANSAKTPSALARTSAFSMGTRSSYTVSSMLVYAFWHAPNSAPMLSRNRTMAKLSLFSVARNARCSTRCATPHSSGASAIEPTSTVRASAARSLGLCVRMTWYVTPFSSVP